MVAKVKDVEPGKTYVLEGMVALEKKMTTKNKPKPYLLVAVTDDTDTLYSHVWDNHPLFEELSKVQYFYGQITIETTQNDQYLNHSIIEYTEMEKPNMSPYDTEAMVKEMRSVLQSITDKGLKSLAFAIFKQPVVKEHFFTAPANLEAAYNVESGLLAHTLRMVKLLDSTYAAVEDFNQYVKAPTLQLHRDLLVVAILAHDLGKLLAFTMTPNKVVKTTKGELFEDSFLSMKLVEDLVVASKLSERQQDLFLHVVGASKGSVNFGATHTPRTVEAYVLSTLDKLDYTLGLFEGMNRDSDEAFVKNNQKMYGLLKYD